MILTVMSIHDAKSLRLVDAWRGNSRQLSIEILQQDETDETIRLQITFYAKSDAEFNLLLAAIPKADHFKNYDDKVEAEAA